MTSSSARFHSVTGPSSADSADGMAAPRERAARKLSERMMVWRSMVGREMSFLSVCIVLCCVFCAGVFDVWVLIVKDEDIAPFALSRGHFPRGPSRR